MNGLRNIFGIFVALCCASIPARADLWGGKSQDSFEVTYELIQGVELKAYPMVLDHPYEVVVANTSFGDFMVCQLFDAEGEVVATQYANSQNNVTRLHFETKVFVEQVKCAYTDVVETDGTSP